MNLVKKLLKPIWQIVANFCAIIFVLLMKFRIKKFVGKKKILFIIPYTTVGGAEKVALLISKVLSEDGWDILIVTTRKNAHLWTDEFKKNANGVIHLGWIFTKLHLYIILKFNDFFKFNLVLTSNSKTGYKSCILFNQKGIPCVDLIHGEGGVADQGGTPAFSSTFDKYLTKRIVISQRIKNLLIKKYGVSENKISVIYNGIEDNSNLIKEKASKKDKIPQIIWVGRLSKEKRPEIFVEIAKSLPEFKFQIIGDGELMIKVKEMSQNLKNFEILGYKKNDETLKIIANSNCLVLTSEFEGTPTVILEAMNLKVPVVSVNVGAINEIIEDKVSGYLISNENKLDEFKDKIQKAVNQPQEIVGNAFKKISEKFSISKMSSEYLRIFNQILNEKISNKKNK